VTHTRALGPIRTWYLPVSETSTRQHTTFVKGQTSTPPPSAGFEPSVPESERPQTHTFDRAAPDEMIFVTNAVALGLRFLLVLVFPCQYQSIIAPYSCITGAVKSYKLTASLNKTSKRKSLPLIIFRFQTNLCTLRIVSRSSILILFSCLRWVLPNYFLNSVSC
jgi:hypothetical protein